nr:ribosome recycling factor family protein [Vibrio taketomensis]
METEQHKISLPSLIHRIGRDQVDSIREMAVEHGCLLKRIRRSRNWQVEGSYFSLRTLISELAKGDSLKFQYVIKKLNEAIANIEPPRTIEQQLADLLQKSKHHFE